MIEQLPKNFLQSSQWAKVNELIGHKVIKVKFGRETNFLIIKSARRGRYLEIPGGPVLDWANETAVAEAFAKIREIAAENKCVFVRLRPQILKSAAALEMLAKNGARPAPMHLHAEHTVMIDLTQSEEDLLANMRRQTRYEVRRAKKLGITVESGNSEELFQEFHAVQLDTAHRQHFIPPDLKTLLAERAAFGKDATIYVAYANEEGGPRGGDPSGAQRSEHAGEENAGQDPRSVIAYGLILKSGAEAAYFEAASTALNRKLPGAYALQWQVMKDLKKQGVKRYNLWGIAPPGAKNHRYSGVTTFKTGFGGEVVEFVPAHDLVISKARYQLDLAIEKVRKKRRKL